MPGPHDFAVRISVVRLRAVRSLTGFINPPCDSRARLTLPRPPHPAPNVRDDRETPLFRDGMAGDIDLIWVKREGENFFGEDWTGGITLILKQIFFSVVILGISPMGPPLRERAPDAALRAALAA
jgi:hypothetical protein